jgi:hypothetical protein
MHRFRVEPEGLREVRKRRRKHKVQKSEVLTSKPKTAVGSSMGKRGDWSRGFDLGATSFVENAISDTPILAHGEWPTRDGPGNEVSLPLALVTANRKIPAPEYLPPGAGLIDPFNTLPVINAPRTQLLLYHGRSMLLSPCYWHLFASRLTCYIVGILITMCMQRTEGYFPRESWAS